jgi:broad specificity phosphatase PhoE
MSNSVHVIRHGEVHNPEKILYGRQPGWRLSDRGQEMAQVLGQWSKGIDLGALHVSPLQRAQETAAPIAAAHSMAMEFCATHQRGDIYGIHGNHPGVSLMSNK